MVSGRARIGQKNSLTRVWGQTGSRPAAPKDLGLASAYAFGAVCPSEGKAAALIMPICNTAAMNLKSWGLYELYRQHVEQLRAKKRKEVNATDQGSKPCPLSPESQVRIHLPPAESPVRT